MFRVLAVLLVLVAAPAGLLAGQGAPDLGIRWIEVEAGTFTMSGGGAAAEKAVERFLMSATEVTFGQYDAYCEATGGRKPEDNGWGRGQRPVFNVSYDDALGFCRWLSEQTGCSVRLPTEAEWIYAAQGGCHSRGYGHSGGDDKDEVSWNEDNSGNQTHPVGTKKPNELGLFDMSGNLWEWCSDGSAAPLPGGTGSDAERLLCGNSFDNPATRMDYRRSLRLRGDSRHINIGFRLVKSY